MPRPSSTLDSRLDVSRVWRRSVRRPWVRARDAGMLLVPPINVGALPIDQIGPAPEDLREDDGDSRD